MTILVIDDDPFQLKLVTRQLQSLGEADILTFESAEAALLHLVSHGDPAHLVLLDLQMPGMDGVEAVRNLTYNGYAGGLALISGEDDRILQTAAMLARAHRLNLHGALRKPVATAALKDMLERHRASLTQARPVPRAPGKVYTADELRAGIANGELVCHFQPKVALATGAVDGVESLVRWQHPRDGLVYPDRFIALAEEADLIGALTEAVLRQSLHQAQAWQDVGLPLCVSVNVSMDNLTTLDFPDKVVTALAACDLPAERLLLEVTESRLMRDPLVALDILARLRLRRIGLAIDDFGTGHSSFQQLRDIPFTELKIDRGFVTGAWHDAARRTIFEATLRTAKDLGLVTVAEGAEDIEDWRFLRASGCDLVQGYFVARPMPGDAIAGWMMGWAGRYAALCADEATTASQ